MRLHVRSTNPFASHRWETEVEHRIWIPPEASVVASTKACLISGLRGTGKTALLNCLDRLAPQRERIRFLNPEALHDNCIGVYINIMKEFTDFLPLMSIGETVSGADEIQKRSHARAFRTYLIFTSLARSLEVIDECRRYDVLAYTGQSEKDFSTDLSNLLSHHFGSEHHEREGGTILECVSVLLKVCMTIRVNSLRLYGERVELALGSLQPAKFYTDFCTLVSKHGLLDGRGVRHHVKISLDDVHRFGPTEQALLNGLLEVNTAPITWNLSFVTGLYDPTVSPDPDAPLTRHDVERVDLNYEGNRKGFRRLCKKLYETRLGIPPTDDDRHDEGGYAKALGRPDVSVLFGELTSATASASFKQRLFAELDYVAEKLAPLEDSATLRRRDRQTDRRRYLYQTYVFVTLFGAQHDRFEVFLKDRTPAQVNNYFRQKNVAALIAAANELGRSPLYAGTNALVALADGCVRDFLLVLAVLYDNAKIEAEGRSSQRGPEIFSPDGERLIPIQEQSRSFVQASISYLEQIDESTSRVGRILSSMIDGVAHLTRLLQSQDPVRALALPERGQILLNFAEATLVGDAEERIGLLRRAIALGQFIGAVRIVKGIAAPVPGTLGSEQVQFRLHRLVAPAHRYSSRGPFRVVSLPLRSALEFTELRQVDSKGWASRVFDEVHDLDDDSEVPAEQPGLFE